MYIAVADSVSLEDATNFGEFHVAAHQDVAAVVAALDGRATSSERDNHLWIDISYVRELAGDGADAEWDTQFKAMLDYAASKGWVDEINRRVEAHIQPPE